MSAKDEHIAALIRNNERQKKYDALILYSRPDTWSARMPAYYGTELQAKIPEA